MMIYFHESGIAAISRLNFKFSRASFLSHTNILAPVATHKDVTFTLISQIVFS